MAECEGATHERRTTPSADDDDRWHDAAFAELTPAERRLAFYAKIYDRRTGRFKIGTEDLKLWKRLLPAAVELECLRIDEGLLPRTMTLATVSSLTG